MARYLQNLRQTSDAFVDVGFCDSEGRQTGYAGPYSYLRGKDYSSEDWFVSAMTQERNYFISDVYLGFRNKPHFTIAVRHLVDTKPYIVKATLDPDKFYIFLRNISRGKGVDSTLIGRTGQYQVADPGTAGALTESSYMPAGDALSGVDEIVIGDDRIMAAYAWLEEVPWVLVVRQSFYLAYPEMMRAKTVIISSTILMTAILGFLIWQIAGRLLLRAQQVARSREELQTQLLHASKLASVGELAGGVAHEINNPLAIISATRGVISDMLDPEFGLDWTPETIKEELATIELAVSRARDITHKLLNFSRKNTPALVPSDVNTVLENTVGGIKEQELQFANIELVRDYQFDIPEIRIDPDQIGQVLLNLVNNASDAAEGGGTITLSTRCDDEWVYVSVGDTGAGMTSEQLAQIFSPFYTTKPVGKGTGLGLSISLNIVESMGGRIDVQSLPGKGSLFTVVLPIKEAEGVTNESE